MSTDTFLQSQSPYSLNITLNLLIFSKMVEGILKKKNYYSCVIPKLLDCFVYLISLDIYQDASLYWWYLIHDVYESLWPNLKIVSVDRSSYLFKELFNPFYGL